jgi:protein-disulfide isomerase
MASNAQQRQSRREQLEAQRRARAQKERRARIIFTGSGILALVLVVSFSLWGISAARGGGQEVPINSVGGTGITLAATELRDAGLQLAAGAPTLDIYSDYGCPHCKEADAAMGPYIRQLAEQGQANVVIHSMNLFPVSRQTNIAAACADIQGVFTDFHFQMFATQDTTKPSEALDDQTLRSTIPSAIGLTGTALSAYQACFDAHGTGKFVDATVAYAAQQRVTSTPTFFLNGRNITQDIYNPITSNWDADLLRAQIDQSAQA